MISPELVKILCCPETHQPVRLADPAQVTELNTKIAAGNLHNRTGKAVSEKIDAALIRQDGQYAYVIRNKIPVMLIDEAVKLQE